MRSDTFTAPNNDYPTINGFSIITDYDQAWDDYRTAYEKLSSLLASYNNREKFAADFPDLAKHIPPLVKSVGLPCVIVTDVMAELAKVGVPAGAK